MSVLDSFTRARALLGLGSDERDPRAIKQAYRRQAAAHPPDQDPETFQALRAAYELLSDPLPFMDGWISQTTPDAALPAPQVPPLPQAHTARALLAAVVARLDLTLPEGPSS